MTRDTEVPQAVVGQARWKSTWLYEVNTSSLLTKYDMVAAAEQIFLEGQP